MPSMEARGNCRRAIVLIPACKMFERDENLTFEFDPNRHRDASEGLQSISEAQFERSTPAEMTGPQSARARKDRCLIHVNGPIDVRLAGNDFPHAKASGRSEAFRAASNVA